LMYQHMVIKQNNLKSTQTGAFLSRVTTKLYSAYILTKIGWLSVCILCLC